MLTSNRAGGKGSDDLYSFELPALEFCYQAAYVFDDFGTRSTSKTPPFLVNLSSPEKPFEKMSTDADPVMPISAKERFLRMSHSKVTRDLIDGFLGDYSNGTTIGLQ